MSESPQQIGLFESAERSAQQTHALVLAINASMKWWELHDRVDKMLGAGEATKTEAIDRLRIRYFVLANRDFFGALRKAYPRKSPGAHSWEIRIWDEQGLWEAFLRKCRVLHPDLGARSAA